MTCSIFSIEISMKYITDHLSAFDHALNIIKEKSTPNKGIKEIWVNHDTDIYKFVSLSGYKGNLIEEKYSPGVTVYWTNKKKL